MTKEIPNNLVCPICNNILNEVESRCEINLVGVNVIFAKFFHDDGKECGVALNPERGGWIEMTPVNAKGGEWLGGNGRNRKEATRGELLFKTGKITGEYPVLRMLEEEYLGRVS